MIGPIVLLASGIVFIASVATGNVTLVCSQLSSIITGAVILAVGVYLYWRYRRRRASGDPPPKQSATSAWNQSATFAYLLIGIGLYSIIRSVFMYSTTASCSETFIVIQGVVLTGLGILALWGWSDQRKGQSHNS